MAIYQKLSSAIALLPYKKRKHDKFTVDKSLKVRLVNTRENVNKKAQKTCRNKMVLVKQDLRHLQHLLILWNG